MKEREIEFVRWRATSEDTVDPEMESLKAWILRQARERLSSDPDLLVLVTQALAPNTFLEMAHKRALGVIQLKDKWNEELRVNYVTLLSKFPSSTQMKVGRHNGKQLVAPLIAWAVLQGEAHRT